MIKILTLTLILGLPASALAKAAVIGKVIKLKGESTLLPPHQKEAVKVKVNQNIHNGSSLSTGNSYITVRLTSHLGYVKLGKNSKLDLAYLPKTKTLRLFLYSGYAKVMFKQDQKHQSIRILTQNGLIETNESKALVMFNPLLSQTSVIAEKGSVTIANANPQVQLKEPPTVVSAGQHCSIEGDKSRPGKAENMNAERSQALMNIFHISSEESGQMEL